MEQAPQTKQAPELPADIAQAANLIDEALASAPKSREEHNRLAAALRLIINKVMEPNPKK